MELDDLKVGIIKKELKHNLESIAFAVGQLWGSKTQIIDDFTDHGIDHCDRIAGYINKILKLKDSKPLSEIERFLLIAGIYLHDIGMQCDIAKNPCILREAIALGAKGLGPFAAQSASKYSDDEAKAIRKNHHLIAAAWIRCAKKDDLDPKNPINIAIKQLDPVYIQDIMDICMYHSTLEIHDCSDEFVCQPAQKGRKRLVAALLRLGDELDIDKHRASQHDIILFSKPPESEAHWMLHLHTIIDVNSDTGQIIFCVDLKPEDEKNYGELIKERYIDRFFKKNQHLLDLLRQKGLQISFSNESGIRIDEYATPLTDTVYYALTENLVPSVHASFQLDESDFSEGQRDRYDWTRFWVLADGRYNLSEGGYLYDPSSEWGHIHNPGVVPFEKIANTPCIVLLGEPGSGKTQAMMEAKRATEALKNEDNDKTFLFDLSGYESETFLIKKLFESEEFVNWQKNNYRLHIFLDNIDGSLVRAITKLLVNEIESQKNNIDRLYIRIACRLNKWSTSFENDLKRLWGTEAIGIYQLAPLRRADVTEAARARGLNETEFLHEIDLAEAVPLAIKPITLQLLLNKFGNNSLLNTSQIELYLDACSLLCEEVNSRYKEWGLVSVFDNSQILLVATRIAAVTMFSKFKLIWTDLNIGSVPKDAITIQELKGGFEKSGEYRFHVNEHLIRETLNTALFSFQGRNQLQWTQQTYCEFLAARYLVHNQMTTEDIMDLFTSHENPRRLFPQLFGVAAWVASMRHDVFCSIMKHDPEVLLQSDLAIFSSEDRTCLIDTLLKQYDNEMLLDINWDIYAMHKKLNHPNLADQLKTYICDKTKNEVVRCVAISIADACGLNLLQEDLASIALDSSQSLHIRALAARSVGNIGDDKTKSMLRPLAYGDAGEDPSDELKGLGFRSLWPNNITAEELFAHITPPKEFRFGAYHIFLSYELADNLETSDLSIALKWAKKQKRSLMPSSSINKLIDMIMVTSWNNLDYNIINDFAEILILWLEDEKGFHLSYERDSEFIKSLSNDDGKRRQLVIEAMLPLIQEINSLGNLVYSNPPLISNQDFNWALDHLKTFECTTIKRYWARLVQYIFDINDANQIESILLASKNVPELREEFEKLINGIELKSPLAEELRKRYQRSQDFAAKREEKNHLEPSSPSQDIVRLLDDFEGGNRGVWWHIIKCLTHDPNSNRYGELEANLSAFSLWRSLNNPIKERIIKAAEKYLLEQDPETSTWINENALYAIVVAGYNALRLLLGEAPNNISNLPQNTWKKWAPAVLSYPSFGSSDASPHQNLVKMAYQNAPEEIIDTLKLLIEKENREFSNIFVINHIDSCWDGRLASILLEKAKEKDLKPQCMDTLLNGLLLHGNNDAKEYAESLVASKDASTGEEILKAIYAAKALLIYSGNASWSIIWSAIQSDPGFGERVIELTSQNYFGPAKGDGHNLSERQLADLYIWLAHKYPPKQDPSHEGVFKPGIRDRIANFRDSILNQLKIKGSLEACEEIMRIKRILPDLDFLKWTLYEAQINTRRKMWKPLPPKRIIELAQQVASANNTAISPYRRPSHDAA